MFSYQVILVCSASYNILVHCSLRHGCTYVLDKNTGKAVETKYMSADTLFCFHYTYMYKDKGNDMLSVKLLLYTCICKTGISLSKEIFCMMRVCAYRMNICNCNEHAGISTIQPRVNPSTNVTL